MSKLTATWDNDCYGNQVLVVRKSRGKINHQELSEFLLYQFRHYGFYINIINANESVVGGNGMMLDDDPKGDIITLYRYDPDEECPVCRKITLPDYCPECGNGLKCASCGKEFVFGKDIGGDGS